METIKLIVEWYAQHRDYIDLAKDIIFAIGVVATFYGYFKFLRFLTQRKVLNRQKEMENDARLYKKIRAKFKDYVDSYGARPTNLRDIGIRLLHMNNYPYNLENDGFRFWIYYYFLTERSLPDGYISGKGLYIMENLWYFDEAVYYNPDNCKWFIDKKGQKFRKYRQLKYKHLVKRIPFANILGYDFDSDWSDKGEPVFYTKYKYNDWKLFADSLEALSLDNGKYPLDRLALQKGKRTRRMRPLQKLQYMVRNYVLDRETRKIIKQEQNSQKTNSSTLKS